MFSKHDARFLSENTLQFPVGEFELRSRRARTGCHYPKKKMYYFTTLIIPVWFEINQEKKKNYFVRDVMGKISTKRRKRKDLNKPCKCIYTMK